MRQFIQIKASTTPYSGLILIMSFAMEGHGFVIAGDKYEIVLDTIAAIDEGKWEKLKQRKKRSPALEEEVAESVHFVGPEKGGDVYRFVVVRRKSQQMALFSEY